MRTNQIYIARDGKSGMHVLVRILAVDDIGKDYLPIDPDDFNKLMMARYGVWKNSLGKSQFLETAP